MSYTEPEAQEVAETENSMESPVTSVADSDDQLGEDEAVATVAPDRTDNEEQ